MSDTNTMNRMRKDYIVEQTDAFAVVLAVLCDLGATAVDKIDENRKWEQYRDRAASAVNLILDILTLSGVDAADLAKRVTNSLSDMFPGNETFDRDGIEASTSLVFQTRAMMMQLAMTEGRDDARS